MCVRTCVCACVCVCVANLLSLLALSHLRTDVYTEMARDSVAVWCFTSFKELMSWKQSSIHRQTNEENMVHIHNRILSHYENQ